MSNFSKLEPTQQEQLLNNIKSTQKIGLLPAAVAVGHCLVLLSVGLENLGFHGAIGWVASLLLSILATLAVAVTAVLKQRKLVKRLAESIDCDSKTLLKEARKN